MADHERNTTLCGLHCSPPTRAHGCLSTAVSDCGSVYVTPVSFAVRRPNCTLCSLSSEPCSTPAFFREFAPSAANALRLIPGPRGGQTPYRHRSLTSPSGACRWDEKAESRKIRVPGVRRTKRKPTTSLTGTHRLAAGVASSVGPSLGHNCSGLRVVRRVVVSLFALRQL